MYTHQRNGHPCWREPWTWSWKFSIDMHRKCVLMWLVLASETRRTYYMTNGLHVCPPASRCRWTWEIRVQMRFDVRMEIYRLSLIGLSWWLYQTWVTGTDEALVQVQIRSRYTQNERPAIGLFIRFLIVLSRRVLDRDKSHQVGLDQYRRWDWPNYSIFAWTESELEICFLQQTRISKWVV